MPRSICFAAAIALAASCFAEVRLPSVLSDGMVLQRDLPLPIWGWADPGEQVAVSLAGQTHTTTAGDDGRWRVELQPLSAGEVGELVVAGANTITVSDVLAGEVWLCSGQSNMQWELQNAWDGDLEIAKANHPTIRLLTITPQGSQTPVETSDDRWQVCTPENVKRFSAVGYLFGRELQEHLGVPIGLIDNAWGGSACEAWVRRDHLEADPRYAWTLNHWDEKVAAFDVEAERAKYEAAMKQWKAKRDAGEAPGRQPRWSNPLTGQHRPANLYNGRLMPVIGYGLRGAIWYQGESNSYDAQQYAELFPLMIRTWREAWGQGDFPFYWVQLADFKAESPTPQESDWAELREAQTQALDREPNTGQAVIIDIGEASDIHPRNKRDVALRLARHALANDYGVSIAHKSPRYASMEIDGAAIVVTLQDCQQAIRLVDGWEPTGLTIAGEDKQWFAAEAQIVGKNKLRVWSDKVPEPVAVRYAWADNPVCNLYTTAGLPVTPFRTDDWPTE